MVDVSNSALNNPEPERTIAVNRGKVSDITTAFQRDGTSPEPVEKAVILVNVDDRSANIPGLTKVKYLAFYIGISVALTLSTKALLKEVSSVNSIASGFMMTDRLTSDPCPVRS